ncbi:hypothetical protein QVD17_15011 [Tagetes erecta]|uniref:Uncharacterized protein n=1 Tax=Tagetes erecta TaxID=13708 RepID=A0AAD8KV67_TARER|nr:hypothetical protein QVD17_15011 [Tagetes erecta]
MREVAIYKFVEKVMHMVQFLKKREDLSFSQPSFSLFVFSILSHTLPILLLPRFFDLTDSTFISTANQVEEIICSIFSFTLSKTLAAVLKVIYGFLRTGVAHFCQQIW